MSLMLSMLPIYLLGNLHCIGMCGPLVLMLGKHPFKYYYFLGRLSSFSLAAALAGGAGAILYEILRIWHIPALASFTFGGLLIILGIYNVLGWQYPGHQWLGKRLATVSQSMSMLLLKEQAFPAFMFGFFTVLLPCGQTVIVFSACALAGDVWIGFWNGFVFALLTSPSLWFAMHAHKILGNVRHYYHLLTGMCAILVGMLALCRGLADMDVISHLILHKNWHLILY